MKKNSETIHNNHAKQKAARDKEREKAGYKGKGQSIGPSHKEENTLSGPLVQKFIAQFRLHRAKQTNRVHVRLEYKPRKV